jgi:dethiobiotin synthetase
VKRYFITGTDTDCGKTFITRQLLDSYPNSMALKPIASGCIEREGTLVSEDALILQQGSALSLDEINPWRFELPVSPHIAAARVGCDISIQALADYCLNFHKEGLEHLLIEGAGGLMVPLNSQETWIDFLKLTQIPVLLVVGMRLGCINHALLTAHALKTHSIQCLGWVANCLDPNMLELEQNISTLERLLDFPLYLVQNP